MQGARVCLYRIHKESMDSVARKFRVSHQISASADWLRGSFSQNRKNPPFPFERTSFVNNLLIETPGVSGGMKWSYLELAPLPAPSSQQLRHPEKPSASCSIPWKEKLKPKSEILSELVECYQVTQCLVSIRQCAHLATLLHSARSLQLSPMNRGETTPCILFSTFPYKASTL